MNNMIYAMKNARDALSEYYKDEAPVVALIEHAIVDAEVYVNAYESLFKENVKLRSDIESFRCVGVIDSDGNIYPEQPEAGAKVFVNTPS